MSIYSNRKSNNQKMDRVARRGPLGRAPGTLKWDILEKKQTFKKSLTKTERGPFGIFQHPFCQKSKKMKGGPFGENFFPQKKSRSAENN